MWNRFVRQHKLFVKSNRNCHNKSKLHFKDTSLYNFTSIVVAFCFLHSYNLFNLRVNKQKIVIQISSSSHTSTFSSHSPIICFILIKFQAMDWVLATLPKDLWDLFRVGSHNSQRLWRALSHIVSRECALDHVATLVVVVVALFSLLLPLSSPTLSY